MMSREEIKLYIWINGKKGDSTFSIRLNENTNSIRRLKILIASQINTSRNLSDRLDRMLIFNYKGMEIDDSDIPYLQNEQILYLSIDGSPFNVYNYVYEYIFVQNIKSGGYGKVYLAKHCLKPNQFAAIKKIDVSSLNTDEIYNISREALYMESFNHRNIIKLINSYIYEESFYSVMEHAQGGELSSYIEGKGLLGEMEAKRIFKQVHEAVKYIHGRNVIHRDLKPNNILFLDKNYENIVLIDFGISGYNSGNVKETIKAGTTKFVPPELAAGLTYSSSPKFDVWALGVILYLMLFGKYPFDGKSNHDILNKIIKEKHKFPNNIVISKLGYNLINALLEKNAQLRIEMTNSLFEDWYNDISSDEPIIKPNMHMSTINTDLDDSGVNGGVVNTRSSHSNSNHSSISPKKRVHHRMKSISISAIDSSNSSTNNAYTSPYKFKTSPRSNSFKQSKLYFMSNGKNANPLSSSLTLKKHHLLQGGSSTSIPNFENIMAATPSSGMKNSVFRSEVRTNSSISGVSGVSNYFYNPNKNRILGDKDNKDNKYNKDKLFLPLLRSNK